MARQKEFDREEVLGQALELFWKRGYADTSMSDLVEHLGVGRQSLYDTFGDKHGLYLAALDVYRRRNRDWFRAVLHEPVPVRRAIGNLLETLAARQCGDGDHKGCMLLNAAMERAASDPEVRRRAVGDREALERALLARLEEARESGEIARHLDPASLARFFASTVHGLVATAKITRSAEVTAEVARVAVSVLG